MATIKKTVKKAQSGTSVGNAKGYNAKTSPLANKSNKGNYEKKLDTIGSGTSRTVRMLDGKGNVMQQERMNSTGAKNLSSTFNKTKSETNSRRTVNSEFLDSKNVSGKTATKSMGSKKTGKSSLATMKMGGTVKKKK